MFFFFFNDTATTEIYTLSLHDALPILKTNKAAVNYEKNIFYIATERTLTSYLYELKDNASTATATDNIVYDRSEEHTSELQSRQYLVCRLLLEKKQKRSEIYIIAYLLT